MDVPSCEKCKAPIEGTHADLKRRSKRCIKHAWDSKVAHVLTAEVDCNSESWRLALEAKWEDWVEEGSHILVISGVHGKRNHHGRTEISRASKPMKKEDMNEMCKLAKKYNTKEKNIKIVNFDINSYVDEIHNEDDEQFLEHLRFELDQMDLQPTIIVHAFCESSYSIIMDLFTSGGLHAEQALRRDLTLITGKGNLTLDNEQMSLVRKVVTLAPRLVFLWGSPGTGKTILGEQAALVLAGKYARKGKRWRLFVVLPEKADKLLKESREKHKTQPNITVISLEKLCREVGLTLDSKPVTVEQVNTLQRKLEQQETHTIIFLDEICYGVIIWNARDS